MTKKKAATPKVETAVLSIDEIPSQLHVLQVDHQRTIEPVGSRYAIKSQGQITAYYNSLEAAEKDLA